jgi:hypothetical protein
MALNGCEGKQGHSVTIDMKSHGYNKGRAFVPKKVKDLAKPREHYYRL